MLAKTNPPSLKAGYGPDVERAPSSNCRLLYINKVTSLTPEASKQIGERENRSV